jgi:hypothetical protein
MMLHAAFPCAFEVANDERTGANESAIFLIRKTRQDPERACGGILSRFDYIYSKHYVLIKIHYMVIQMNNANARQINIYTQTHNKERKCRCAQEPSQVAFVDIHHTIHAHESIVTIL